MCKWVDDKMKLLEPYSDLPLRLALGVIFIGHGGQHLFGWWDGPGFQGWTEQVASLGMHPAPFFAALGGGGELVGGILVLLGLFTRFGALLIAGTMANAIMTVHLANGLFAKDGGFEYPLSLLCAALLLLVDGARKISLDTIICKKKGE